MLFSGLALSLATVALAAPTSNVVVPPKDEEFTVAFSVGFGDERTWLVVQLENDPSYSKTEWSLVGRPQDQYHGTPAYRNGTGFDTTALVFDLTNQTNSADALYGASAVFLGESYGSVGRVGAFKGYQQFEWTVNGTISHALDAAPQSLFWCNGTLNGEDVKLLEFGVFNENSQPPTGCELTAVKQVFNVPGGATGPPK